MRIVHFNHSYRNHNTNTMSTGVKELWSFPTHHVYEGVTYCDAFRAEALDKIKDLELAPDDILLCNYPKSGTCMSKEIDLFDFIQFNATNISCANNVICDSDIIICLPTF